MLYQYKAPCTATTSVLYRHYKRLVRTLQASCTDATSVLYGRYKAPCTGTTKRLQHLYERLFAALKMLLCWYVDGKVGHANNFIKPIPFNYKLPLNSKQTTLYYHFCCKLFSFCLILLSNNNCLPRYALCGAYFVCCKLGVLCGVIKVLNIRLDGANSICLGNKRHTKKPKI